MLLDEQRLMHCTEFLDSMQRDDDGPSGVLFSGPNGVGKSSICLMTFLTCFVRGLPVVYIPRCDEWEGASEMKKDAHAYFMRMFLEQNADLIVQDKSLLVFFKEQLDGKPADTENYCLFSRAVLRNRVPRCGFIADEVQKLTMAAAVDPNNRELPKKFFATDFTIWTGPSGNFCSQLCASV